MKMPRLPYRGGKLRRQTVAFTGLDRREAAGEGALRDCAGLSDRAWPCLTVRSPRLPVAGSTDPTDLFSWDGRLVVVDGTTLYCDGAAVGTVTAGKKQFAVVNSKLCVWPDKLMIDGRSGACSPMETEVSVPAGSLTLTDSALTARTEPPFADLFKAGERLDVTGTHLGLADADKAAVLTVKRLPDRLTFAPGTFRQGGRVCASAPAMTAGWDYYYMTEDGPASETKMRKFIPDRDVAAGAVLWLPPENDRAVLWIPGEDGGGTESASWSAETCSTYEETRYLTTAAYAPLSGVTALTVRRPVPDLAFICESGNRLWGVSNAAPRTIFASALGDPTAFWSFDGVAADSFSAAVGSEGDFTALCAFAGGVCCFKERVLHKVSGSFPAEYYVSDYPMPGVRAGAERTVCAVGGTLFYLGRDGAYAFGGSTPVRVSDRLGPLELTGAAAGTDGRRYLLGGTEGGRESLYSFDPDRGIWLREDALAPAAFARTGEGLFLIAGGALWRLGSGPDADAEWMALLAPWEEEPFSKRGYTRLLLRLDMAPGSFARAEIREDLGLWRQVWTRRADRQFTYEIPLRIGRCSRFELRLSGQGEVTVRAVAREYTEGSEHGTVY